MCFPLRQFENKVLLKNIFLLHSLLLYYLFPDEYFTQ